MKDYLNQHSKPVTRRDFITRGLYGACGYAMAPSLLGLLLKSDPARADSLNSIDAPAPRFLCFDLAGGAALFANFLVGGAGGPTDLLPSYSKLGWDPRAPLALDKRFGLPMAGNQVSQVLMGMLKSASAEAQGGLRFGSLLHIGQIDTQDNPLSILSLVDISQLSMGSSFPGSMGLLETYSGGQSRPLLDVAANRSYFVKDLPTLINCVGLSGAFQKVQNTDRVRLAKLLQKLSASQLNRLLGNSLTQDSYNYISSAFTPLDEKVQTGRKMDPRNNSDFQQIYGINPGSDPKSAEVLRAALVMNTLTGQTGPSVITIPGCDYHDGTQSTGDAKDLEIGVEIGRAVEAAKRLKVPLFIHIITDGGIYPAEGSRTWQGDSVETSMTVLGYYSPQGAPQYRNASNPQIGSYTSNQGADRSTLVGSNTALVANAALANYLNIAGKLDSIQNVYPGSLPTQTLEQTLIFG